MRFAATPLTGAFVIDIEPRRDERGLFARTFCRNEFRAAGLPGEFVQASVSYNIRRGTLRGMHFQAAPREEPKLVRCTHGAIHDVIVDLRRDSPTHCRWFAVELTQDNRRALYVPPGFAHGFQSLVDDTEILYQMAEPYAAELARGVRWNDPAFAIAWPIADPFMSERDASYADYRP
ncbi:MAG TPA: dTDP-4-dehydrorhamnose 3,5-epimerase [Candidatus Sulfotelmatobacter sp.]|nr:dTDP-4-dehydrorhamnose 3,5-epimerase [Candidatus Sulfotelmatobacter sp.]